MSNITDKDFERIAGIIKQRSGLVLTPDKLYLLESRLTPIARRRGMADCTALVSEVLSHPSEAMLVEITEAMTTNESLFFRDPTVFKAFETQILPHIRQSRLQTKSLRIWCAAASTGQEPYSIAMMFAESPALWSDWSIEIVGTDICSAALARAKQGHYTQFEVQRGLPISLLVKYFSQDQEGWKIAPKLQSMLQLRHFNLLDSYTPLGQFDIIFCRNVLIYFDAATKTQILEKAHKQLAYDGVILLGASKTVLGLTSSLKPVPDTRGIYAPADSVLTRSKAA